MAKKVILKDQDNVEILPITRGELIVDSSGKEAFHSNEFLATNSQPGLMSPEEKAKLSTMAGNTIDSTLSTTSDNPVQNKVVTVAINEAKQLANDAQETANDASENVSKVQQIINSIKASYLKSATVNGNVLTIVDQSDSEITFTNTTYNTFLKETAANTGGRNGLVPKPNYNDGSKTRFLREDGTWVVPTDTKNTAGSTNSTSKLFLIGATSQAANPQTYSNSSVYTTNGTLYATTFVGNLDGTYINKLTGYKIAEAIGSIAATDSLNTALGKLEFKTDFIYNDLFGTDNDDVINKWHEIVDFVDSVAEGTDITDEFVTRKTAQTVSGKKTFSNGLAITGGSTENTSMPFFLGIDAFNEGGTVRWITANKVAAAIGALTQHQSLANYVTLNTAQTITGQKLFTQAVITKGRVVITGGQALEWQDIEDRNETSCLLLPRESNGYRLNYYDGTNWHWLAYSSDVDTLKDYYWANVKISKDSSTTTSPTFANVTMSGILTFTTAGNTAKIKFLNGEIIDGYGNIKLGTSSQSWNTFLKDGTRALSVYDSGNVGIGTTSSAAAKLHIIGNALLSQGANGDLYYRVQGVTHNIWFGLGGGGINRGIWDPDNSSWMLYRDATTNVLIPQGYVGLGTLSPIGKLHIVHTSSGSVTSNNAIYVTDNSTAVSTRFMNLFAPSLTASTAATAGAHIVLGVNGDAYNFGYIKFVYTGLGSTSNAIRFGLANSDNLVSILGNGNVGVGTTAPKSKLSIYAYSSSTPTLGALGNSGTAEIGAAGSYGTYFWTTGTGKGYIQQGRSDGTATAYDLILQMLGGNVGIGTSSPGHKLQVQGRIMTSSDLVDGIIIHRATAEAGAFVRYLANNQTTKGWRAGSLGGSNNFTFEYSSDTFSTTTQFLSISTTGLVTCNKSLKVPLSGFIVGSDGGDTATVRVIKCYDTTNLTKYINMGNDPSAGNSGEFHYSYVASASTSNNVGFGFYSGNRLKLYYNGGSGVGKAVIASAASGGTEYELLHQGNYKNYVDDMYWANISVSSTSSTTTKPTFANTIVNGILTVNGGFQTLRINHNHTLSTAYNDFITCLNPNLTATYHTAHITFGRTRTSKNNGYIGFKYAGDTSNSNMVTIGLQSVDNILNILASGNVGIGTLTPSLKLDVIGSIQSSDTVYGKAVTVVGDSTVPYLPNINWFDQTKDVGFHVSYRLNETIKPLRFYYKNGATYTQLVDITSTGSVGIGTTAPIHKLQVAGAGVFNNTSSTTYASNGITIGAGDAAARYITCYGKTGASYVNVGYGPGANNSAEFAFSYTSDGSTSNYTIVSMYGAANSMKMYPGYTQFIKNVQAPNYVSSAATGTQPYACTSTTCNTNLNADMLDGYHAGSFGIWRGNIQTDPEADDTTYTTTASFLSQLHSRSSVFNSNFSAFRGSWYYVGNINYNTGVGTLEMAGTAVLNISGNCNNDVNYKTLLFVDKTGYLYSYVSQESGVATWSRYAKTSEIPNPANYYWANVKVSASSSTSTQPTFNTCYTSNWFRSTGATGWYNESYAGGWYMTDTTYVRTYNSKAVYVSNTSQHAIYTAGGFASSLANGHILSTYYNSTWYTSIATHGNGNLSISPPSGSLYLAYTYGNTYFGGSTYYINRSGYFNGTAAAANSVAWVNVTGKPTIPTVSTRNLTVNGTAYAFYSSTTAAAASFYAPTSAGTSGYILQSSGGTPTWTARQDYSNPGILWVGYIYRSSRTSTYYYASKSGGKATFSLTSSPNSSYEYLSGTLSGYTSIMAAFVQTQAVFSDSTTTCYAYSSINFGKAQEAGFDTYRVSISGSTIYIRAQRMTDSNNSSWEDDGFLCTGSGHDDDARPVARIYLMIIGY